jgi:hypothetical protein
VQALDLFAIHRLAHRQLGETRAERLIQRYRAIGALHGLVGRRLQLFEIHVVP